MFLFPMKKAVNEPLSDGSKHINQNGGKYGRQEKKHLLV